MEGTIAESGGGGEENRGRRFLPPFYAHKPSPWDFGLLHHAIHLSRYGGIHFDERRPWPFEAFPGQFSRRIDAEFGADSDLAGGVIQNVGGTFGKNGISLRVGRSAQPEKHLASVMHVHVFIYDNNIFCKHHLTHPP